jgi:hypothetical protein
MFYISGVAGLLAHLAGTYYLWLRNGKIVEIFKGYTKSPGIVYSIAVFVLIKYKYAYLKKHFEKLPTILSLLSSYTFGVYLVHIYVI